MLTDVDDIRGFKIFAELDDRELDLIAKIAKTEELGAGATLTRTDAPASTVYLIKKGRVTVLAPGPEGREVVVDELGPEQIIGWSTLTGPYIYRATTVTAEPSTLIVISGSKLRQLFEVDNQIGYRVLKGLGYVVARLVTALENKIAGGRIGQS